MINPKLEKAINEQINFEIYSAYIYLSMAGYLRSIDLNGFAHWLEIQFQEEIAHSIRFYNFINDRAGKVEISSMPKPKSTWKSVLEVFEDAYKHEQIVTARINNLMDLAIKEKDHAAVVHLQWFVNEQVEEESNVSKIINQLKLAGDSLNNLFLLDKELSQRVFVNPNQPSNNN